MLCMFHLIVEAQLGLQVPTPSSIRHVQPSCGMLEEDLFHNQLWSACLVHRHPSGRHDHTNGNYRLCFVFCFAHMCICMCVHVHEAVRNQVFLIL